MGPASLKRPVDAVVTLFRTADRIQRLLCDLDLSLNSEDLLSVVLVNDCAPSVRVHRMALELKRKYPGRVTYIRHQRNRGYLRSLHAGIEKTRPTSDLVLLNCDTRVFGNWCARLQGAAYSKARIASVSPLTNNLRYLSLWRPAQRGTHIEKAVERMDLRLQQLRPRAPKKIPSTFGFCMYIKRSAWDRVGGFDEKHFSPGYGEEVDWCFRAHEGGYIHAVDPSTCVYHHGTVSFGVQNARQLNRTASVKLHFKYPKLWSEYLKFKRPSGLRRVNLTGLA